MGFTYNMSGVAAKINKICTNRKLGLFLANTAAAGMDQYVPLRTGQLKGSVVTKPFKVTYTAPYAIYPFIGVVKGRKMKFRIDQHPKARARWDRAYAEAYGKSLGREGTQFIKTEL